ncbi:NAD(P)/FAD-dependent oxidoreductase [Pseudonocardia sp. CA-107938]|uniref:NAD(P)/FAD-dependent oxidoreductase n=1 Tax=Pseudonocardia sp. CA-107938 TaxID=3240021 RepID=UPI003D94EE6E
MSVVVVGAGIAGIACARELAAAGVAVQVRERADRIGGRMCSPELDGRPVDLGAAYFTVRDDGFAGVVDGWRSRGLVRTWTDTLDVIENGTRGTAPGPMRWAAPGGLGGLVADLATGLDVRLGHTVRSVEPGPLVDGEPTDAVVLAMPDPQVGALVDAPAARGREWRSVLAVAMRWRERVWAPFPAAFVNGHPLLTSVADDGDRRGDGAPVLVAHATGGSPAEVVAAARELLDLPEPESVHAHHWPHAAPVDGRDEPYLAGADGIALAGDGWGSSRVETAWRSGSLLGRALAQRLATG